MGAIVTYLKNNKRWWIPPILIFLAVLLFVVWKIVRTPEMPFEYTPF